MNMGSALFVCLCLLMPAVSLASTPVDEGPDPELLEFLGEWSDDGEKWLQQEQQKEQQKSVATPKTEVKQDDE